jgi:multiple sugar transport system permease protein
MQNRTQSPVGALFALPAMAGLLLFVAIPFLLAIGLSLTNVHLGSPLPVEFVGATQYIRLFADPAFTRALVNSMLFTVIVVPLQTVLALALALLLNQPLKGRALFRTLFFMPVVFPLSLVSVIWILIYAPGPDGMLNGFLQFVSFGHWQARDFLHDPMLALPAIMLTSIWQGVGFQMVIVLAGLQGIPEQLYEAARLDGAGRFQRFWHITLPGLRHTLTFVMLVTTILAFRLFEQVQIMTHGGPNRATATVMFEAVQAAFGRQQVAMGAAITVVFFIVVLLVTLLQRRISGQARRVPSR